MNCPYCGGKELKVTNVRNKEDKTYRIRKCLECEESFTTYEVSAGGIIGLLEDSFNIEVMQQITSILEREYPTRNKVKDILV